MMTRLRSLPALAALFLAACAQAPGLQAMVGPRTEVVLAGAYPGGPSARVALQEALQQALPPSYHLLADPVASPVHAWVGADLVRYDVALRVRNASSQYEALNPALEGQIPVNATAAGSATFTQLRPGAHYRAYVKAMGRQGGSAGSGEIVQLNANATGDFAEFDFTADNDVASVQERLLRVQLDAVAFAGVGGLHFGSISPGAYASPSGGISITGLVAPTPTPTPTNQGVVSTVGIPASKPYGLAVAGDGSVWVSSNVGSGARVRKLSSAGSLLLSLDLGARAVGVATTPDGSVWVQHANGVAKLSSAGSQLASVAIAGIDADYLADPGIDSQGQVWVAALTAGRVVKLSSQGAVLGTLSGITGVTAVAVDPQDRIWVATQSSHLVRLFNNGGSLLGSFSVGGVQSDVAIGAGGTVWVVSEENDSVTLLASNGSLLGTFGAGGSPRQVAVDAQGNAWVSYINGNQVRKLASNGSLLGTFSISLPFGVAVDRNHATVWVGSLLGQVFTIR